MKKILFSLPVHTQANSIIDLIININKFVKNAMIVLHVSLCYEGKDEYELDYLCEKLKTFKNVYINSERLDTKWGDIIHTHISNFKYMKDKDFDVFYMSASNELFVKKGVNKIVDKYDFACQDKELNADWWWIDRVKNDEVLKRILEQTGGSKIMFSNIEGTFYSKSQFNEIANLISTNFDRNVNYEVYPREEIYFSTIARALNSGKGYTDNLCYMRLDRDLTAYDVFAGPILKKFSIKRVEREPHNFIREYVRKKIGKYDLEYKRVTNDLQDSYTNKELRKVYFTNRYEIFKMRIKSLVKKIFRIKR